MRESSPYATCELTASLVVHAIVALNGLSETVCTSAISIGGAATVGGSGAISGADPSDGSEVSANDRGFVVNWMIELSFSLAAVTEVEVAATPFFAVASASFSGVSPMWGCAGR